MGTSFDDILNECIERVSKGEALEQCLASYPDHSVELEPLLRTSAAAMSVAAAITYRPEAKQRSRYKFTSALADRNRAPAGSWLGRVVGPMSWWGKLARIAAVALGIVVLASGTAFGAARAAADSVPGDPLYAVKTLTEDISLRMPKSDMARAKEHAHLANVRTEEIAALIDRGRLEQATELVVRVTYHLNSSAQLVGVTITANANPLEMPSRPTPRNRQHRMAELASFYERDAQPVRTHLERRMRRLPDHQQWAAYIMMQQWEMMNRMFLQALSYDGPSLWPVWIDQGVTPTR